VAAGDALLIALIENDVAIGDGEVGRFKHRDFVGLQAISANADVNISVVDRDDRTLCSGYSLLRSIDSQEISGLYGRNFSRCRPHRLILLQWINVRSVSDGILDLAIDGIGLLRAGAGSEDNREREAGE